MPRTYETCLFSDTHMFIHIHTYIVQVQVLVLPGSTLKEHTVQYKTEGSYNHYFLKIYTFINDQDYLLSPQPSVRTLAQQTQLRSSYVPVTLYQKKPNIDC